MHINDQSDSFWRCRERFLLPPGLIALRAVAGHWDIQTYSLSFTADAGHTYFLRRQRADASDRVVLLDGGGQIVAQAERQQTP